MTNEIKQRIEQINNGEVPEGYTHKYHIKPDLWMDEPLDAFFYKVKEKNSEKKYNTVFTNSATNGVIPQSQYFEKDIANEENIDGYYIVRAGDYIYNPRISEKAPYGPINQNLTGCTGIASPLYTVFSKKENVCICDDYIRYYLDSAEWNKYIYSVANYGARFDRMNISDSNFMNMPIALPPFAEQQKISEILMQCDKLIELYQNETDELQKLKKICLCKMFPKSGNDVPEWRFPQFTDAWEQRKLGDVATFINGRAYSQPELLSSGKYKVLRVGNFYTNDSWYYSDLELGEKYYADYGDLLYTWSATFGPHIWLGDRVIYHYHIWKIDLSNQLEKQFAVQLLEQDKANILSSKNGSTMVHITKEGMEQKDVIIPPSTKEQQEIGAFFQQLDNLITLHQRKLAGMEKQKKSLTQLLLTGIVRVKV
ncbi:restriction endonuclease subunit S [Eubacterium sp.]